MSPLRFDGQVAIITGAGGALGRSYAMLLAARGAKILVNDLGTTRQGQGCGSSAADAVVSAIREQGGEAIANYDSVEHGNRIVQHAIDAFGRVDIVINNAGFVMDQSFQKMDSSQWDAILAVHVRGAFQVTRAAWTHMRQQNYGRIIMTSSGSGIYGNFGQASYSAAKLALVGLSNTLAIEGAKHNVFVNSIAPIARSRITEGIFPPNLLQAFNADYIAPVVAYLCHRSCQENGSLFEIGGGWVSKLRWQQSQGSRAVPVKESSSSIEHVAERWHEIVDFREGATFPTSLQESTAGLLRHVQEHAKTYDASSSAPASPSASLTAFVGFKCAEIVARIKSVLEEHGSTLVPSVRSVGVYTITDGPEGRSSSFIIDLKNGNGSFSLGEGDGSADCTFTLSDEDFVKLIDKDASAQELFMQGKLSLGGDMMAAMKFEDVLDKASKL